MKKWIYIAIALIALALIGAVATEAAIIKAKTAQIATLSVQVHQQSEMIKKLSEMEAVSLNIRFEVKNTAVFGAIKNGDYQPIMEGSLRYLRKELIQQDTFAVSKTVDLGVKPTTSTGRYKEAFDKAKAEFNKEYTDQIKALYPTEDNVKKIKLNSK